jgi:hypothetical protein
MQKRLALLALATLFVGWCWGQSQPSAPTMILQEARRLMKEAWENEDRDPDLAIRLLFRVLRHYPEGFEVRLPEYLDDIWRTQGEQAYWKAVIDGQTKGILHPSQMARLTIGGLLARIFFYAKKDARQGIFWAKQVRRRNPEARVMLLIIARSQTMLKEQRLPKQPELFINGQPIKAQVAFQKQAAFVALQDIQRHLSLSFQHDALKGQVVIRRGKAEAVVEMGKEWGLVRGEPKELSGAPYLQGERVMVPIDLLAELLRGRAYWDEEVQLVHLFFAGD